MRFADSVRAGLIILLSSVSFAAVADVVVSDAYVRAPVPGRAMSAAFMTLTNNGSEEKVLVSANAPWADSIEIHTHMNDNGVMRMRQLQSLTIPAGESVTLQPGGLHLMLFGLQLPLGESLPLTLCFEGDECIDVQASLRSMHSMNGMHGMH